MKTARYLVLLTLLAMAPAAFGAVPPPIPAPGQSVVWTAAGGPYLLESSATIPATAAVVIEAGASVHIASGATLSVEGSLTGTGTPASPIQLTSSTIFPPSVEVRGTFDLAFADLSGQMRPLETGTFLLADSRFTAPGGVFNFSSNAFPFIAIRRTEFQAATIDLSIGTLVLENVAIDGSYLRSSTLFKWDGVTVRNSPFEGFILANRMQPAYLDQVYAFDNVKAGFSLYGGGDFYFGRNTQIQGNAYPVELYSTAGITPGSTLPKVGNTNNYILGPGDGDARFGQATWGNVAIPYVIPGAVTWFGSLDIEPGTSVRFMDTAGLILRSTKFFRGLPDRPITFEPLVPGQQWYALGFTNPGSGVEYCNIDGGGLTVAVTPVAHMENSTLTHSSAGLSPGSMSDWFVSGSRFFDNPIAAHTNSSGLAAGGLHLDNPTNPNSFFGNGAAIQDITPNGSALNDAENVWWGDATGPQHPLNPGGQGDPIIGSSQAPVAKVDFTPWLTTAPSYDNHPPVVRMESPYFLADAGTKIHLRWEVFDDDSITEQRILFNAEGNYSFDTVVATLSSTERSFEWTVPHVGFLFNPPSFLRIVAVDETGKEGWDQTMITIPSEENPAQVVFTQQPPTVARPGESIDVCWDVTGGDGTWSVGQPWIAFDGDELFETSSQFGNCLFLSRMPAISTDSVRVVVPLQGNCCNRVAYFFSEPFAIRPDPRIGDEPPTVEMLTPQPGDTFAGGSIVPVTWTASDDEALRSFDVQTSYDGGRTWQMVARDLGPATRSFDWLLPTSTGIEDVRVRVIAHDLRFQNTSTGADTSLAIVAGQPDVRITLVPKTTTAHAGENLLYDVIVENLSASSQSVDAWIDAFKANGGPVPGNPLGGPKTLDLAPGRVIRKTVSLHIPGATPASGPYRIAGRMGSFGGTVVATSSFAFDVVE